jgi:hypothetical protein
LTYCTDLRIGWNCSDCPNGYSGNGKTGCAGEPHVTINFLLSIKNDLKDFSQTTQTLTNALRIMETATQSPNVSTLWAHFIVAIAIQDTRGTEPLGVQVCSLVSFLFFLMFVVD